MDVVVSSGQRKTIIQSAGIMALLTVALQTNDNICVSCTNRTSDHYTVSSSSQAELEILIFTLKVAKVFVSLKILHIEFFKVLILSEEITVPVSG